MPARNAFDVYMDASRMWRAASLSLSLASDLRRATFASASRAPRHLATRWHVAESLRPRALDEKPLTRAEREALHRLAAPALARVRQGFALVYLQPLQRNFNGAPGDPVQHYWRLRTLARLLAAEGRMHQARGDHALAASSFLDGARLAVDVARGAGILGMATGTACHHIALRPLWDVIEDLDAPTALRTARRLEALEARRATVAEAVREERRATEAALRSPGYGGLLRVPSDVVGQTNLSLAVRILWRDYGKDMGALGTWTRVPYAARSAAPTPATPLAEVVAPNLSKAWCNTTRAQTESALLRAALALRAYALDNKKLPDSLGALVPKYLRRVPQDPFALDKPLQFKRLSDGKYSLYSIGPDGRDNGGRAAINRSYPAASRSRYWVTSESIGDIVAGLNR